MAEGTNKRTLNEASLSPDSSHPKKHQAGGSPDNGGDSTAQNHPNEISVSAKLSAVDKIAVICVVIVIRHVKLVGLMVKLFNVICVRDGFMPHVKTLVVNITNLFQPLQSLSQIWCIIVNTSVSPE